MMLNVYLDANLLIAVYFQKHSLHAKAKRLLKRLAKEGSQFYISSLTLDEYWYGIILTLRGMNEKYRNKHNSFFYSSILQATVDIFDLLHTQLLNIQFSQKTIFKTAAIIKDYDLKPRDAFHITFCLENEIDMFATFDEALKKRKMIEKLKIV